MNVQLDPRSYPEILDPAGSLELRSVKALERIATALEQLALAQIPATIHQTAPEPAVALGDLPPWESAPIGIPAPVAAVYQAPVAVTTIQAPPPWVCPIHHTVKVVPAGVSKRTGAPYEAFLSCTERDCPQKPPFVKR